MDIDPILFPAVTNRESWTYLLQLNDEDTGEAIDLTDYTFVCEVRCLGARSNYDTGYSPNYDYGSVVSGPTITVATTIVGTGEVQLDITEAQLRSLSPATYSIAMTASNEVETTRQIFLGHLPVKNGRDT